MGTTGRAQAVTEAWRRAVEKERVAWAKWRARVVDPGCDAERVERAWRAVEIRMVAATCLRDEADRLLWPAARAA